MAAFIGGQMNKNLDRRRHMANDPDQCYYNSPKGYGEPMTSKVSASPKAGEDRFVKDSDLANLRRSHRTRTLSMDKVEQWDGDGADNSTPAWMVTVGNFVTYFNQSTAAIYPHVLPTVMAIYQYRNGIWFNRWDALLLLVWGYYKVIIVFGIFHRYFSHTAFYASRPMSALLGVIASLGAQRGALWWASKHTRHHKFCENEGDPHSWDRTGSLFYAFVGWSMHPCEMHIDWKYLPKQFKTPELLLVEAFSSILPYVELAFWYKVGGMKYLLMCLYVTVATVYLTLSFNVLLHHDPEVGQPQYGSNGRYKCKAHNKLHLMWRFLVNLMAEMDHLDHHKYPKKALHPTELVDIFYWTFIYPGEKLGIFYKVNLMGTSSRKPVALKE